MTVEALFDEFASAYAAGMAPDVVEFLRRAGNQREDLGLLVDRFLASMPARATTEEDIVLMEAQLSGVPPLLVLRNRRKLARSVVVDAIVTAFGITEHKRAKVVDYYHRLETGLLDPRGVSIKVFGVMGTVLGANIDALGRQWPAPPEAAFQRGPYEMTEGGLASRSGAVGAAQEPDEVDHLFTAARRPGV